MSFYRPILRLSSDSSSYDIFSLKNPEDEERKCWIRYFDKGVQLSPA